MHALGAPINNKQSILTIENLKNLLFPFGLDSRNYHAQNLWFTRILKQNVTNNSEFFEHGFVGMYTTHWKNKSKDHIFISFSSKTF